MMEEKIARKEKKKLEKQLTKGTMKDDEEVHAQASDPASRVNALLNIYRGGPASAESRKFHCPLNSDEKWAFSWRRLCDAAFQEHPVLKSINFNWKSYR